MEHYSNFNDAEFKRSFADAFDVERMMMTSFDLNDRQRFECKDKYEKQCCVDFAGETEYLLFEDDNCQIFENVLKSIPVFNKKKIRMRFRFMLVYPYSVHAISRIQAEVSKDRSSIKETKIKNIHRNVVNKVESVDLNAFMSSNLFRRQQIFLRQIGYLLQKYDAFLKDDNVVSIRFVPTAIDVCMYRVNNCLFISPYLLAKEYRIDTVFAARSPVLKMMRNDDRDSYDAYMDHFKYLWNLPHTIYLEDATYVVDDKMQNGITNIKPPQNVDYKYKSISLKKRAISDYVDSNANSWILQVKDLLFRFCLGVPIRLPVKETVFIACAWGKNDKYLASGPNTLAQKINNWLNDDLDGAIDVHILQADVGGPLQDKLYSGLNSSTVGIILLTCDVECYQEKYYAKPNIYHELGYLMGKYEVYGYEKRIIPIVQRIRGSVVEIPSNITDRVMLYFQDDDVDAIYGDILISLYRLLELDISMICFALRSHLRRVESLFDNNSDSINWAESIRKAIIAMPCDKCGVHGCAYKG